MENLNLLPLEDIETILSKDYDPSKNYGEVLLSLIKISQEAKSNKNSGLQDGKH